MKKYILFYLLFCLSVGGWAKDFVHPGILHSSEALRRIAGLVKNDVNPSMGSFNKLKAEPEASYHYCIQGPFRFISRSGEYGYTKSPCEDDFNAAYYNAIMWNITKDRRHADKAMEIIRNYAATLEKIFPMDAPLCAGLQGFILVNAAEIMRYTYVEEHNENGWTYKDTEQTEDMFRNVFLPILSEFYKTKPYTNGNWGIAVTKAQIGISVFLNDTKLYDDALDFFYHGKDNGTLPNYVAETGQIQESGRDQAHCMLGIGCLAEIAEVAWNQGDDLYGALDNRIMKGCEYLSKSNCENNAVHVFSGSLQPGEGNQEYRPVFNMIDLDVRPAENGGDNLHINLQVHYWNGRRFEYDINESSQFQVKLTNNNRWKEREQMEHINLPEGISKREIRIAFTKSPIAREIMDEMDKGLFCYDNSQPLYSNKMRFLDVIMQYNLWGELWSKINK